MYYERKHMEDNNQMMERLEAATALLERALATLQEKQGEVERISATVEQTKRELDLTEKLAAAEREISDLKAAAVHESAPLRKTVPALTSEMLAKHGIGDGPVDVRALDAALSGLSLEQRIAVKTQLLRAGAIA
jgi:ATP-dependent Lon protease